MRCFPTKMCLGSSRLPAYSEWSPERFLPRRQYSCPQTGLCRHRRRGVGALAHRRTCEGRFTERQSKRGVVSAVRKTPWMFARLPRSVTVRDRNAAGGSAMTESRQLPPRKLPTNSMQSKMYFRNERKMFDQKSLMFSGRTISDETVSNLES
jgi:hypothetical protein